MDKAKQQQQQVKKGKVDNKPASTTKQVDKKKPTADKGEKRGRKSASKSKGRESKS